MADISIIKDTGTNCTTASNGRSILYLVIHYSAGTSSKKGSARSLIDNWFKNSQCQGSADFAVDDEEIVQYNPDIRNRYCWAVGGSKYTSMTTSLGGQFYGKCTNKNSISIEIISNKTNKKSLGANDSDWYFTESEIALTAKLANYLMKEYNIPIERVIMHHQVTGKVCPNPWVLNESRLSGWSNFKARLGGSAPTVNNPAPSKTETSKNSNFPAVPFSVKVIVSDLNYRDQPSMDGKVKGQTGKGSFTIIEVKNGWGKLKSEVGWIYLENANYVTIGSAIKSSTTSSSSSSKSFLIKITAKDGLKIRSGPGTDYKQVGLINDNNSYTIVETKSGKGSTAGWGKLKSGAGWISLDYVKKV